jgi:hypothetical protein
MENKKVKNATRCEYADIHFKSILEMKTYMRLESEHFTPQYETKTFHLQENKKVAIPYYDIHVDRKLKKKIWGKNPYKLRAIKYTPDIILYITDSSQAVRMVIIECKGKPNDVYPYKKKLFLRHLDTYYPSSLFFEIHNLKQLQNAITIIKNL